MNTLGSTTAASWKPMSAVLHRQSPADIQQYQCHLKIDVSCFAAFYFRVCSCLHYSNYCDLFIGLHELEMNRDLTLCRGSTASYYKLYRNNEQASANIGQCQAVPPSNFDIDVHADTNYRYLGTLPTLYFFFINQAYTFSINQALYLQEWKEKTRFALLIYSRFEINNS